MEQKLPNQQNRIPRKEEQQRKQKSHQCQDHQTQRETGRNVDSTKQKEEAKRSDETIKDTQHNPAKI